MRKMDTLKSQQLGSVAEISDRFHVSKYFLRKQIKEGRLPYYKIGNCFMLYVDDVRKLIESYRHLN